MKKEILRMNNLNFRYGMNRKLEDASLYALEGECLGFRGLTYSGKDLVVGLLTDNVDENIRDHHVYIAGRRITSNEELAEKVYRITASNYIIEEWSVAEYIGLVESSWLMMLWKKRRLEEETASFFEMLEVPIDVSRKLKELSELEKRIVDVVKALKRGAKVLVVEDEFEGMRPESIRRFSMVMRRLIHKDMAVIVNSHSDMVLSFLSDKYIIFKKGRIVKKCKKEYITDSVHLEKFLMGNRIISQKRDLDMYRLKQFDERHPVYSVCHIRLKDGRREDFRFAGGEVSTVLVLDRKERERLFMLISGRTTEGDVRYILENQVFDGMEFDKHVAKKVVSVMHLGNTDEVFSRMSVGENLLLPSLCKISSMEYIATSGKMARMLEKNMGHEIPVKGLPAKELEINDLIRVTLERWYIYNPKVLVLFEPFIQCDLYGVSIVKSCIKKFANRGTAVIIIKSREEYMEDISDKMINID